MKRLTLLALLALAACDEKKPPPPQATPPATPSATASAVAPKEMTSAATAATPPEVDNTALLALHAKYEAPAKELITAVTAAIAEEKKKQASGASKKFSRVPLPASKLAKDANVLQVAVANPNDLYVSVQPLNASPRAGSGNAALVPPGDAPKARCPSEYSNDAAADLTFVDGPTLVVTVKTDACKGANAQRDAEIERVKKMAEPIQKDVLAHAAKIPAKCETPKDLEPEIGPELKKAGFVKARLSCRNPNEASWQAHGASERKYDRKTAVKQPAWRTTGNGFSTQAYYLTDDTAEHNKPFQLTFIGTREDKIEIEAELFLE